MGRWRLFALPWIRVDIPGFSFLLNNILLFLIENSGSDSLYKVETSHSLVAIKRSIRRWLQRLVINKMLTIHTDGSCLGNPGPGGWAAISVRFKVCGGDLLTTNNKMEIRAAIEGLEKAIEFGENNVKIVTDSNYVKDGITKWIKNWEKKNWKTSTGSDVKNQYLWKKLLEVSKKFLTLEWEWVRAHNGDPHNEAVDTLARKTAELISDR
jgi:ribonuclease HI